MLPMQAQGVLDLELEHELITAMDEIDNDQGKQVLLRYV